jgi:hypothetical protein
LLHGEGAPELGGRPTAEVTRGGALSALCDLGEGSAHAWLGDVDELELLDYVLKGKLALSMQLTNLTFFHCFPVSVFACLVLLEEGIELPEEVGVDVLEEALDVLSSKLVDAVLQGLSEVSHLVKVTLKGL